jgi:hypothetical protein
MKAADAAPVNPHPAAFTIYGGAARRRRRSAESKQNQLKFVALFHDCFAQDPKETGPAQR